MRKRYAQIVCPFSGEQQTITWSIHSLSAGLLPISLVHCHMEGMDCESDGYGDSIFFNNSLTQAFAESWERLWMRRLKAAPLASPANIQNSNGFACGSTVEQALTKSQEELIERAIFLKAWENQEGWSSIPPLGFRNAIFSTLLSRQGWRMQFFQIIEAELGDLICGLGTKEGGGILFDCCYSPHSKPIQVAQSKVLRSLLRISLVTDHNSKIINALPENAIPEDHSAFYRDPNHFKAFDFLERLNKQPPRPIKLGYYDGTSSKLLIATKDFPFVALSTNPRWPQLSWGYQSLQGNKNPWPHPLA